MLWGLLAVVGAFALVAGLLTLSHRASQRAAARREAREADDRAEESRYQDWRARRADPAFNHAGRATTSTPRRHGPPKLERRPTPTTPRQVQPQDDGSGFVLGAALGYLAAAQQPQHDVREAPAPEHEGRFGGAGASASWEDTPRGSDGPSYESPSDSPSSDSGSGGGE